MAQIDARLIRLVKLGKHIQACEVAAHHAKFYGRDWAASWGHIIAAAANGRS